MDFTRTIRTETTDNGYTKITEASGPRVTASKLETGKAYLDDRLYCYRRILAIGGDRVIYDDSRSGGPCYCSKSHFVRICSHEATSEEVLFIDAWEAAH